MSESLIDLEDVIMRFGALAAVDRVSLSLGAGEVCGLVGPNGSGKTTLLNVISGILKPTEGTVRFGARNLTAEPAHVSAQLGLRRTFQLLRLLAGQTVLENIMAGMHVGAPDASLTGALGLSGGVRSHRAKVLDRAMVTLEGLGIAPFASDTVDDLPFGVQRRVELGRAIISEPKALLLDEPASGLDDAGVADLKRVIQAQRAEGSTVLLVDHHLEFVLDVCPRVVVMNYGRVIFDGQGEDAVKDESVRKAYIGD